MSDWDTDHAPAPRRRLPDVGLPPADGGPAVPIRAHRRAALLVLLGDEVHPADGEYLRQLADARAALEGWDGRVLVVAAGDAAATRSLDSPFPVLRDPAGAVAAAAGVGAPAVVVADQWGEVHAAVPAAGGPDGPARAWMPPAEAERWLRFLAVRCGG